MPTPWPPRKAEIHLVHHDPSAADATRMMLEEQCARELTVLGDAAAATEHVRDTLPDLLLVYGRLDEATRTLLEQVQFQVPVADHVPVVLVTDDPDPDARRLALELGVTDVIDEPHAARELCHRIRNHLAARLVVATLQHTATGLEKQLADRDAELERRSAEQLEQLRLALAARDADEADHAHRIATSAWLLAIASGASLDAADALRQAAPLHDVGKLGIPEAILTKPGPLTKRERQLMQRHTTIGARLLGASHAPLSELAGSIALSHHERWDGGGYPYGFAGDRIPRAARIVAVASVFDALTYPRCYREAWPVDRAVGELERVAGSQLDPQLVDVFVHDCVPALAQSNELDTPGTKDTHDTPDTHDGIELFIDIVEQRDLNGD